MITPTFETIFDKGGDPIAPDSLAPRSTMVSVDDLDPFAYTGQRVQAPFEASFYDGEKFLGGFGATQLQITDYWTLRQRSYQLFNDNLYARGLIRRLITNEINTGLTPEAAPEAEILGTTEDALAGWSESTENLFNIWGKNPAVCDWRKEDTFGAIQRKARQEALVSGDVLVVVRQNPKTKLPRIQLISGDKVRTPLISEKKIRRGHEVRHGVELDRKRRVVAYWVRQDDDKSGTVQKLKRMPAFGERSGRRIAWLVFGTDKRLDDVRGQPMLSIVLQSLKEIDRYRDSAQRKAVINSILAMFIEKGEDKLGSLPMTSGAVRRDQVTTADGDGGQRVHNVNTMIPGVVMEDLQVGEKPHAFESAASDINFGDFEEAIISGVSWANEIPPEILKLAFSNNYSASQAAINEFKIYLNKVWSDWGETFCTPIYIEWLVANALQGKIVASRLLESWRNPALYDVFGAWTSVIWYGSIKPSTDMLKAAKGSQLLLELGLTTRAREARQMTGTKFSKNVQKLTRENEQMVDMLRPILELKAEFGESQEDTGTPAGGDVLEALEDFKQWAIEQQST